MWLDRFAYATERLIKCAALLLVAFSLKLKDNERQFQYGSVQKEVPYCNCVIF